MGVVFDTDAGVQAVGNFVAGGVQVVPAVLVLQDLGGIHGAGLLGQLLEEASAESACGTRSGQRAVERRVKGGCALARRRRRVGPGPDRPEFEGPSDGEAAKDTPQGHAAEVVDRAVAARITPPRRH